MIEIFFIKIPQAVCLGDQNSFLFCKCGANLVDCCNYIRNIFIRIAFHSVQVDVLLANFCNVFRHRVLHVVIALYSGAAHG